MILLDQEMYRTVVHERDFMLILADAEWQTDKTLTRQFCDIVQTYPHSDTNFAFLDCTNNTHAQLARELKVKALPAMVYCYKGAPVKTVLDINQNIKRVMSGLIQEIEAGIF
jgi:hypothetical protein